jgi:hypothetical protein
MALDHARKKARNPLSNNDSSSIIGTPDRGGSRIFTAL